jgi:penicillin amidase
VEVNPANPNRYRTADGWKDFTTVREEIQIAGAPPYFLEVRETVWGPITDKDRAGRPYALRWAAHQPSAVNLRLTEMLQARTIEDALALTPNCGVPHQNFVCVDRSGKIAWTIIGKIPKRLGANKRSAVAALQQCRWDGFLDDAEYPRVINPEAGRIWSANNRVVGGTMWEKIGNGGVDAGLRAGQIRDRLFEKEQMNERDLLAIQLDDEARSFRKWQKLFLEMVPTSASGNPRREELTRLVAAWDGHASADSVAYRILELFRSEVRNSIYEPFREQMRKNAVFASAGVGLGYMQQQEGAIWALVSARPMHFLSPRFASWQELFLDAADRTARGLQASGKALDQAVWSDVNSVCVCHPLGLAVPLLGCWLDLPPSRLPGARFDLPRVTAPGHGASERFVVSPGKEEQGIFHMPGGQSGHPLSPYYTDGYAAWEKGEATPFLPGRKVNELILQPK